MSDPVLPPPDAWPALRLRPRADRRLRGGHLWVYSNEIDTRQSPLKGLRPGSLVRVQDASGGLLGIGYVNPATLISARLLGGPSDLGELDALLRRRLASALARREGLFDAPFYRLVHAEADGLPGLVVDRYGDWLVGQLNTAGMDALRAPLEAALKETTGAAGLIWRNTSAAREQEGLDTGVEIAWGSPPEAVDIREGDLSFRVPLQGGQKTGWFYDQREHRARLGAWVAKRAAAGHPPRVLDVCCYLGGFGVTAAAAGAEVVCVDASAQALAGVAANAELNKLSVDTRQGDAFDVLTALAEAGERFDAVVVDPPAFIRRKRDLGPGSRAYQKLNRLALRVLAPDGLLVSCSCSFHLDEAGLLARVQAAAGGLGRRLQLFHAGSQGPDHPVHPAIPESRYLCSLFLHALG